MFVTPGLDEIIQLSMRFGAPLSDEMARVCQERVIEQLQELDDFAQERLPEVGMPLSFPKREPGHRPSEAEDPYNAWIWKCEIPGSGAGLLAGKTVSFKDHIPVAGVPLSFGMWAMRDFIPDFDATIVNRALEAGATITGKNAMIAFGGGTKAGVDQAAMGDFWRPKNPHNPEHITGGSSSGSAAALAAGEVDISFGGAQGGSIRMPAAYCGVLGLKPTFGLVSHAGITFGAEQSVDHVGPMARYVEDLAAALEAVAGYDGFDPRQDRSVPDRYEATVDLGAGIAGLRIGVLEEGFFDPIETPVRDGVLSAIEHLGRLGAEIVHVSIPEFEGASRAIGALSVEGSKALADSSQFGMWTKTFYPTKLIAEFHKLNDSDPGQLHPRKLVRMITAELARKNFHGAIYAKAHNVRQHFVSALDHTLQSVDVLALPTCRRTAQRADSGERSHMTAYLDEMRRSEFLGASANGHNMSPFDYTGHPALAIPCGKVQGLPISLQLAGRHYDDRLLLRVAHAYQHSVDWEDQLALSVT